MSISEMIEGWTNYIRSRKYKSMSPEIEEIVDERSKVCGECEYLTQKPIKIFNREIVKYRCSICGCGFPMMVFSMKKDCPKGKWKR